MPGAWAHQATWTVLDTDFQHGHHFQRTWLAWQRDPQRSRMLHYVGIAPVSPAFALSTGIQASDDLPQGWQSLVGQCKGLGAGFHRILLNDDRVSLTLCVGDVQSLLGEHVFHADTVFTTAPVDQWAAQRLARRCKRGTRVWVQMDVSQTVDGPHPDGQWMGSLRAAGFQLDDVDTVDPACVTGTFNPRWDIPTSRMTTQHVVPHPARCAVIGAGIAGASVAHALALRGWDITVFDRAPLPAGGASGLPVGLAVPHVSADDNPRARLSRSGCRLLGQHADRLLVRGLDWNPSGVLEHRPDGSTLWHAAACWIKPVTLVRAWLAHTGVRFVGSCPVVEIGHANGLWHLYDDQAKGLGEFEVVVLANAIDGAALLSKLPAPAQLRPDMQRTLAALQAVHGTLSFGSHGPTAAGLPAIPVNGNGCFIPHVPGADGDQWFAGSTFETDAMLAADKRAQHAVNMERLTQLLPRDGVDWTHLLNQGQGGQWSSTRCVTHDRLPLVGPVDTGSSTGLWLCLGMGSRGLSFAAVCAELLAARLLGEPLPMEYSLSRSLDVNRVRRRTSQPPAV